MFLNRSVLKGGAARYYRSLDFSCDGTKLVTQAGLPDLTLTIWDVSSQKIIYTLQNANFFVNKVFFSPFDPNAFVTCGQGHVKFWRLIETFTGVKSEGLPGKFNEIENDDVCALFFLNDGRVVSNISKGNLAIWRPNAMLELEFSMKNCEPCHTDLVTFIKIYFDDNHVVTAGLDGYIRVWNYSYITSFYNDEQPGSVHVVIEPSYERAIRDTKGNRAIPIQLLPTDPQTEPYLFYAQDKSGGIWMLDLELKKNPKPWEMVYVCHSGSILDMSTSPAEYYFVTVGEGKKVNVYNHEKKSLAATRQFEDVGTSVLWLPFNVDHSGRGIIVGFRSGIVRVCNIQGVGQEIGEQQLGVVQAFRPHALAVTCLIAHKGGDILLSGSEDKSIFIHRFSKHGFVSLEPVGMLCMPGPVCHLTWNPFRVHQKIVMATCANGKSVEVIISNEHLESTSQKSSENRDTYVLESHQVVTLAESDVADPVAYFSHYMKENEIWIESSSHGLYEVGGGPIGHLNIPGQQTVHCFVEHDEKERVFPHIMGLSGGKIRVVQKDLTDVENLSDYWEIVMHNTKDCQITKLCLSYDKKVLYSCGTDSAIFAYKINLFDQVVGEYRSLPVIDKTPPNLEDEHIPNLSLEDEKIAKSQDEIRMVHCMRVQKYRNELQSFIGDYHELIKINKSLPKKLRIPKAFFRLETEDERKHEKLGMNRKADMAQAPLKEASDELSGKLEKIQSKFINLIQTFKFYLFAARVPYCLKSFPERKLFSVDPMEENIVIDDKFKIEAWEKIIVDRFLAEGQVGCTEFERLLVKTITKLQRKRKKDVFLDETMKAETPQWKGTHQEDPSDDPIPDLITATGEFLSKYGKFSMAEQQLFQRIDKNRLRREKCLKDMERLRKLKTEGENITKGTRFFEKLKTSTKNKGKLPTLTEKLYDLLNTREQIYFRKEVFNKKLKTLRNEKLELINSFYWAQQEIKYMAQDIKFWNLGHLISFEMPEPLEVAFELEFPEMIKFEPGPCPDLMTQRMELYEDQLTEILRAAPIELLKMQDVTRWRLYPLLKKRQELFLSGAAALHEILERSVEDYDSQFWPFVLERTKTNLDVNELKAEYNSILQEVDILHRYKTAQRSIVDYKSGVTKTKHVQILKENINKRKLGDLSEQRKECHRTIDDLNAKFAEMIKFDDDWVPYLKALYFDTKEPLITGDQNNSKSFIMDSGESYQKEELHDGPRIPIPIPPGCDEEQFQQTVKLCEQRQAEENRLIEISKQQEEIHADQIRTREKIRICEALLAIFFASTSRYQEKMKEELDCVKHLVKLYPSQIQIFAKDDPLNNVPPMENCKLIEHEEYLTKVQTLNDMKSVLEDMTGLVDKTHWNTKSLQKELEVLATHNSSTEAEIRKLLKEKYGAEIDVNQLQTYVLTNMIKKVVNRSAQDFKTNEKIKLDKIDSSNAKNYKAEAFKMKKDRVKTLRTLYTIQAEKNRIAQTRLTHQVRPESKKMDLQHEKAQLTDALREVEEEERQLRALIEENRI